MKVFLLCLLAIGLTLMLAFALGGRNLGNEPPIVPQKLVALQQGLRSTLATGQAEAESPATQIAAYRCSGVLESLQKQLPIEEELRWLEGYVVARNDNQAIAAAKLERDNLRTVLLAVCAEHPEELLTQAAERVIGKLRQP
ncbi:MAG: hypothetical protein KBA75_00465 [Alphaproteobacteria bacterium]|nr:hypothetical protein [Alphaproteobacteria bacterium]